MTGEKVNPVPIELTLRGESPYIKDAIVFGVERSQTGALVILSDTVNPATPRSELVKLVGPAVELANSEAPSHSRLTEEMLVFLPADTAIPRADKGSFIRRKVYAEFKDVIDCAYSDLEGGSGGSRAVGALGEMRSHIRELIASIAKSSDGLEDDTDLFSYGLDSLAATRIRNALQRVRHLPDLPFSQCQLTGSHRSQEFDLAGQKLPMNFVFEQPTIEKCVLVASCAKEPDKVAHRAGFAGCRPTSSPSQRASPSPSARRSSRWATLSTSTVASLRSRARSRPTRRLARPPRWCSSRVRRARSARTNSRSCSQRPRSKRCTLSYARGTTPRRPSASLRRLTRKAWLEPATRASSRSPPTFRRTGSGSAKSGSRRSRRTSRLSFTCVALLAPASYPQPAHASLTARPDSLQYAWSVNFNLSIASFEPHIRGACNLIQLCLSSRHLAFFFFASSVSAVAAYSGPSDVPEAVTDDPHSAQQMGYARSKWVTEKLCQIASETTPVRAVVLRVGQMVGSTVDGRWNEVRPRGTSLRSEAALTSSRCSPQTEAVSLMIKTGDTLHALPELQEVRSSSPLCCSLGCSPGAWR